jgi:hypothetical protein
MLIALEVNFKFMYRVRRVNGFRIYLSCKGENRGPRAITKSFALTSWSPTTKVVYEGDKRGNT